MVHASLFTGIGGFDLAAEWMGWQNSFQCEIDPFCQRVLAKNFPDAHRYTDIKQFNATAYRGTVDVLSGGFPCQPFSLAGQRKGNQDDRALWPEMLRIIDEVRPRWIVGENVAGLASLGLDSVLFDLEASGYSAETVLLPACSVGAPHRRDRLWIIAYAQRLQGQQRGESTVFRRRSDETEQAGLGSGIAADSQGEQGGGLQQPRIQPDTTSNLTADAARGGLRCGCPQGYAGQPTCNGEAGAAADANQLHANGTGFCAGQIPQQQTTGIPRSLTAHAAQQLPQIGQDKPGYGREKQPPATGTAWRLTEPPLCGPNDGLPAGLVRVSSRAKQLKAYGNSIVPQVAYEIFQALETADQSFASPITV